MGAPSNRLLELAKGFMHRGWEVSVVTAMPNYPKGKIFERYRGRLYLKENIEDINVYRYWIYASNSVKSINRILSMVSFSVTSLFSFLQMKKENPDYILAESPPLTLSLTGYFLSKMTGSKFIMNVSDIWPLTAKELGYINDGKIYRQIEKLESYLYRKSFLCSGQSEEIITHISKIKKDNVYLFRNGVDLTRFKKPVPFENKNGTYRIVYAGLLGVAQGILGIVQNIDFKKLGTEFHIYGDGAERNAVIEYINNNKDRNVFLHESIRRDEIPDKLQEFYCTIIPLVRNIYGAVPSKIYEAMAAGLPILFSGSGEGEKIISDNNSGLVSAPKDYESLERNILKLKASIELRNSMSVNCRKAAEEKFNREKLIEEFSDKLKFN